VLDSVDTIDRLPLSKQTPSLVPLVASRALTVVDAYASPEDAEEYWDRDAESKRRCSIPIPATSRR